MHTYFFSNQEYVLKYLESVAYNRDGLIFRKSSLLVCFKTRCVTKRDALEPAF